MHKVKGVTKNAAQTSLYHQVNGPPVGAGRGGADMREVEGGEGRVRRDPQKGDPLGSDINLGAGQGRKRMGEQKSYT